MLQQLRADGVDVSGFWTDEEFAALLAGSSRGQTDANAVVEPGASVIKCWPRRA